MQPEAVQSAVAAKLLPFVLYSIGVIALFFLFRRSLKKRDTQLQHTSKRLVARMASAEQQISEIEARERYTRHNTAVKFMRGSGLTREQREYLSRIGECQLKREAP